MLLANPLDGAGSSSGFVATGGNSASCRGFGPTIRLPDCRVNALLTGFAIAARLPAGSYGVVTKAFSSNFEFLIVNS